MLDDVCVNLSSYLATFKPHLHLYFKELFRKREWCCANYEQCRVAQIRNGAIECFENML